MSLTILKNQQSIWVNIEYCLYAGEDMRSGSGFISLNDLSSILILFNVEILQVMIV